jgi:hypothetical protein
LFSKNHWGCALEEWAHSGWRLSPFYEFKPREIFKEKTPFLGLQQQQGAVCDNWNALFFAIAIALSVSCIASSVCVKDTFLQGK